MNVGRSVARPDSPPNGGAATGQIVGWTGHAPWSCADRANSLAILSCVLGKQMLGCRCSPRVLDQLAKLRTSDCREPHEHRGIVAVVLLQKEHPWYGAK